MRVLVLFIVAISFGIAIHGIEASLRLSQANSLSDSYKRFIGRVRQGLGSETYQLYGIPVLKHSLSNANRFFLISLTSNNDETITLAVDVEDMGAVAYQAAGSNESYFFLNAPQIAFHILFSDTHQNVLNFDNTFQSIEDAAGTTRQRTLLGEDPLDFAIFNLFQVQRRREFLPVSFLIIIQMVLEASKFRFIEQSIANSLKDKKSFIPDLAIVSLEDNWSELSLQIQASTSLQGLFGSVIELYNSNNELIEVDSIYYPIILANVALQLYHCKVSIRDGIVPVQNYIKMMPEGDKNSRCYVKTRTTRISGREGFCADVAGSLSSDGSRVILYPCGQQVNQKWTFHSDQTIRSLGKCLTTNSSKFGNSLVIYNCSKIAREDITWDVSISGTIMNPSYDDLAMTSKKATRSTNLTMEVNTYAASQGWRVGNYVSPIITSIVGMKDMCLEATDENTNMWLEECVKNKMEQSWALYSDGTIRVNNNHSLCVTSSSDSSSKVITIVNCNGSSNQRWLFMADGTISTPKNETLVMDVAQEDVDLQKIILYPRNGQRNQQWVVFY